MSGLTTTKDRRVLIMASYCGGENTACSDLRPCPACLGMSNVAIIPAGTPLEIIGSMEHRWLGNKHFERLTARQIGKAPRSVPAGRTALAQEGEG